MKPLLRAIHARWRLAAALLGLIVIGVGAGVVVLPWNSRGEASVVFLSSRVVSKQAGGNPYLVFASSLTVSAEVVGRRLMDDQTVQAMRKQGYTAPYQVGVAPDSAGPVLSITVTGTDPGATEATLRALEAAVDSQLETLQSGVRPDARITAEVVSSTDRPLRVSRPKIQLLGELLIAGLGASAGVLLLLQALADRRRAAAQVVARPAPRAGPAHQVDYESLWPGDEESSSSPGHHRAGDHA
ncbi:MAG: hypothetical protein JWR24_984 [Actinoallomurus sp.]|nr:hypothetical protein [Actinoallomurus sp.]